MYSDINRCFIQFMLSKGSVEHTTAKNFITKFLDITNEPPKSLETVIQETNEKITDHMFRLVVKKCDISGEPMCCLIDTGNDNISKLAGEFTTADYEYFGQIMKEVMLSGGKYVSMITCLNLAPKVKQGKDMAQKKIERWVEMRYLVKENGKIYFGARGIAEYENFLQQEYRDRVTVCGLCMDNVYFGEICSKCNDVIHKHCLREYKLCGKKCPICKEEWVATDSREYLSDVSEDDDSEEMSVEDGDLSTSSQVTLKWKSQN